MLIKAIYKSKGWSCNGGWQSAIKKSVTIIDVKEDKKAVCVDKDGLISLIGFDNLEVIDKKVIATTEEE